MRFGKEYTRKLFFIAVPIILSNIISQVQMLIDKMFLGRLDMIYMSAVGNASSPMWTTMNVVFSLTVGSTILISQALGSGDKERAYTLTCSMYKYSSVVSTIMFLVWILFPRAIFSMMGVSENVMEPCIIYTRIFAPVFLTVGIGASVASMLQTAEKTKYLVYYGVLRSVINIILDYALIFGNLGMPELGIKGAALATTIAEFVGEIVVLILVIRDKSFELKPTMTDILKARLQPYIETIRLGIPTAMEDFAWNLGNMMLIVVLNHINELAAGVYTIIFSVELLPVCAIGALGQATMTLSGKKTGEGDIKEIKNIVITAGFWCLILNVVILSMFMIFPENILGAFTKDSATLASAGIYLIIVGLDLFPKSGNILIGSGIRGYGDTKWMLFTQIIGTVFVISCSFTLVYVFHMGMTQLFCVVVADETIRSIINFFRLKSINKNATIKEIAG